MMLLAALLALSAQAPQTPPPDCDRHDPIQTSIGEIQADPDRFAGRCVTLSGAVAGRRIYTGRDGIYLVSRAPRSPIPSPDLRHRLGIDNQGVDGLNDRSPAWATVTGWIDTCQRRHERARRRAEQRNELTIILLGGYCHFEGGPVLVPTRHRISEMRFERMVGEAARRHFGDLAPMPSDWPLRARLEQIADDFLVALRSRDRVRMAELHDVRPDTAHEHDGAMLAMLLDGRDSVFAEIRDRPSPQRMIFVRARAGEPVPDDSVSGVVCYCRAASCADRWPIAIIDVDNAPARPYACTRVEPRDWTSRRAGLSTPASGSGFLAEPAATAFRR